MTYLLIFIVIIPIIILLLRKPKKRRLSFPAINPAKKPVIMIIIDSLMDQALREAIQLSRAPALKFLIENGHYYKEVVSAFPTMSVCIDTTLLTGSLPNEHHIFGLSYFDPQKQRVINMGTGLNESITVGIKNVIHDSALELNQKFINKNVKTIHESSTKPTGSINGIIYRGKFDNTLKTPFLVRLFNILPKKFITKAPHIFSYGKLKKINPKTGHDAIWKRYGMNDSFAREELVALIEKNQLPAFTIVYFPSNDDYVHKKGALEIKGIEKADQELEQVLNAYPSWEEAIKRNIFIILGDSGQTTLIPHKEKRYIPLRNLLSSYKIMPTKKRRVTKNDQLVLCVNERMAYIYIHDENITIKELVKHLKKEKRFDVIAYKEKSYITVENSDEETILQYKENGPYSDPYKQNWELYGDATLLDLKIDSNKQIKYGIYPDGLTRLAGVMDTYEKVIVVTCTPGYEIIDEKSPQHKGGAHGSLHYIDSLVPMIVTGTSSKPRNLRIIDLKDWIINLTNLR